MQYITFILTALVGLGLGNNVRRQDILTMNPSSVASVLATGLPSSLVQLAVTNPAAFSSDLSAAFNNGQTPPWFAALPTEVKSYIMPMVSPTAGPSVAITFVTPSAIASTVHETATVVASSHVTPASTSTTTSGSVSISTTTTSSLSSGGAAWPTAVRAGGVAGVAGLLGMLML